MALVLSTLLGACTTLMIDSAKVDISTGTCHSDLGSYRLPKGIVKFNLTLSGEAKTPNQLDFVGISYVPDGEPICLDLLESITSRDTIGVDRSPSGLLKRITNRANDQSGVIATSIIDMTAQALAAGNRLSALPTPGTPSPIEIDPFDLLQMVNINNSLKYYGYCIYLDPQDDVFAPDWGPGLCGKQVLGRARQKWDKRSGPLIEQIKSIPYEEQLRGVYYRPLLTHSLVVLRRKDSRSYDFFEETLRRRIQMPNAAPTFAVGVDRTLFVDRKTDLTFNDGVLTDVTIQKPSEVNAFITLPVLIVQRIVELPAAAIRIRVNTAQNEAALLAEQSKLLDQMVRIEKARADKAAAEALLAQRPGTGGVDGSGATSELPQALNLTTQEQSLFDPYCKKFGNSGQQDLCRQKSKTDYDSRKAHYDAMPDDKTRRKELCTVVYTSMEANLNDCALL